MANTLKIIAIIQARMSSKRLPNKVLLPLSGSPVIEHIVKRLSTCRGLDEIIIATSTDKTDDVLANWCFEKKIKCFRGSLFDVLDRYYKAALKFKAHAVLRITGDCPLIDPEIVSDLVRNFRSGNYDAYSLSGEFPDGLDCQIFSFKALKKSWENASLSSEREHIGTYIEVNNPELFRIGKMIKFHNHAHYRWTLDEKEDYLFLKKVFLALYNKNKIFTTKDVLKLLNKESALMNINKNIIRNEGYFKSIQKEKDL